MQIEEIKRELASIDRDLETLYEEAKRYGQKCPHWYTLLNRQNYLKNRLHAMEINYAN